MQIWSQDILLQCKCKKDGKRIVAMNTKSRTELKARRKILRAIRKNYIVENKNKEVYFMKLAHFDKAVSV